MCGAGPPKGGIDRVIQNCYQCQILSVQIDLALLFCYGQCVEAKIHVLGMVARPLSEGSA